MVRDYRYFVPETGQFGQHHNDYGVMDEANQTAGFRCGLALVQQFEDA